MCCIETAQEVTCEVENGFDKGVGKSITTCKFGENTEIFDSSTTVVNDVNDNVTRILLANNENVEFLPQGISLSFPNVEILEAVNCSIKSITTHNFFGLTALERMYLQTNKLETLDHNTLDDLVNLIVLYLGNNLITNLPVKLFSRLEKLENLYLFNNQLTTLHVDVFKNNKNLEFLDLSNNKLQNLPPKIFDTLSLVRLLYLDYNEFQSLPPHIFDNCASLERIYLAGNRITRINENWFSKLQSLKMVSFESNPLTLIDFTIFDTNKNITKIDARDTDIKTLYNIDKIKKMPNLQTLLFLQSDCVNNDYDNKSLNQFLNDVKANCTVT